MNHTGEPTTHSAGAMLLDIVCFSAGRWRIGIEARHVRSAHAQATPEAVFTLDSPAAHHPGAPPGAHHVLTLTTAEGGTRSLCVQGPLELRCVPVEQLYRLPSLLTACRPLHALRALLLDPGAPTPLLLLDALQLHAAPRTPRTPRTPQP